MPTSSPSPAVRGVIAAAVTPLQADGQLDVGAWPRLLDFLAARGCHGVLVLGTTGEGTSFAVAERLAVIRSAVEYRDQQRPGFAVLAGTGCASLADTVEATRGAFDLGVDGVVVLPAFYYKGVRPEGLARYYTQVIEAAVPADGRLLAYHIPQMSGVGIPPETITQVRQQFAQQMWGMKDSEDRLEHTLAVTQQLPGFHVFVGSDAIMSETLAAGAAGSITALANVTGPLNRAVWEAHQRGGTAPAAQARLVRARQAIKGLNGPAAVKAALADLFGFPDWPVRAPLEPLSAEQRASLCAALAPLLEPLPADEHVLS